MKFESSGRAFGTLHWLTSALGWLTAGLLALSAGLLHAQESVAGRVVPDSYAAPTTGRDAQINLGSFAGSAPPAGADQVVIAPKDIGFNGDPCPMPEALERFRQAITSRPADAPPLTVADLYAQVHVLEQEFSKAGYVLLRAFIPPQRITPQERMWIMIIDGRIESIDTTGLDESIRAPVLQRLSGLVDRRALRLAEIQRALLLAGDLAGVSLNSAFAPGETSGGVKLLVSGTHRRWNATVGADHGALESVGSNQTVLSLALNGLWGRGEQMYASYQSDPQSLLKAQARMRIMALGAQVPVGSKGIMVNPEVVHARLVPQTAAGVLQTENQFARASLRVSYPLIRAPNSSSVGYVSVERIAQSVHATAFGRSLASDSYLAGGLGLYVQTRVRTRTMLSGSFKLTKGLGGSPSVFGGTAGALPSHQGATNNFTRLQATLGNSVRWGTFSTTVTLRGQSSLGKPLFSSEQLSLDGADALSSLKPGGYAVDEGVTVRAEAAIDRPLPRQLSGTASCYTFGGVAAGTVHNASIVEADKLHAQSFGVGVRTRALAMPGGGQHLTVGVEAGRNRVTAQRTTTDTRVNGYVSWSF